jgi:hypothetical protein
MMLYAISFAAGVPTHDDTLGGRDRDHVGVGIDGNRSTDKQIRGIFLVNGEVDASSNEVAIHELMGLIVSFETDARLTVPRLRLDAFKLAAVSNSIMYRFGMSSLISAYS